MITRWIIRSSLSLIILALSSPSLSAAPTALEIAAQFNKSREGFANKYGTRFAFLFNYTQQLILKSSSEKGKSGGVGYGNLELAQRLWQGAELFAEFEVDRGKGVDKFLPTFSGLNDNSGEDANLYLPVLYMDQKLFDEKILIGAGKLDLSYWFDGNEAANSADTQFLSSALVNSLTLPFPSKGIGAMASFEPCEWVYFQTGVATAKAKSTKTGLPDAFNSAFVLNELGFTPKIGKLQGNYRFIFNLNHEKLEYVNKSDESKKNDFGFAVSFDQAITKRITLFLRYGLADPKVRDIEHYWSCGGQLSQPIPGRKLDILGIGIAQSIFGDDFREANGEDTASRETIYEAYYSYNVNDAIALTPSIQIVTDPNGDKTAETAIVCGLRFLLSF
ncbi:MAG: carbohydrate porin [Candidatus Omnitrophota bacterium]|nr:carbohydrate porin [Candidatus Omnitrophota bacterium]